MNLGITKSDIEKLIELRKEDKFLNHFFGIIKQEYRPTGEIGKAEIKVWKFNLWIAIFYPVFIFHLNSNNELTSISSKLNSFGKLVYAILFVFLTSFFSEVDLIKIKFSGLFLLILFYLAFVSVFILISFKIYKYEKNEQLKIIYETLGNIKGNILK